MWGPTVNWSVLFRHGRLANNSGAAPPFCLEGIVMSDKVQMGDKFPRKFGKYHLLGHLAQGGMGALYLAATGDRGLERLMVIKTVLPHLADTEYLSRFYDEAKIVVKLSHGNLIPVFDAGRVGDELFLAMEFVEGKDLRAMWNRCAKKAVAFPVDVACYIVKELCRGLEYAHNFGDISLVHRDVSPPNVLISHQGEVKLTDFGLASSTLKLEKTAPGIIYGKVAYMSPEQARGEALDGRSDMYATGIILWELLTGRQLFPPGADQPQDLLSRARLESVQPPSKRAPRVSAELDAICVRALASDRKDRFTDCGEFGKALSNWLAKNAPGTDAARLDAFFGKLFAEDLARERTEREALMDKARDRAMTMPPTDEFRKMIEGAAADSAGRRAGDRRLAERRLVPREPQLTERGIAVDVPRPGPGGRTVPPKRLATSEAVALDVVPENIATHGTDFVGQILEGRYQIIELIGEGGMGRVYLAEHVDIGRRVAIKILHPVYSRMPDLVERFRREARAASKIGNPHIVDVTDSGTTPDESVYFVMEYLEGRELANLIDREGALDVNRCLRIVGQICRALSVAHAASIIHRDLKPENIFLTTREGQADFVKVLDFGIAKSTEAEQARDKRLTSPGMAMGTPEYMAPEQAAGRPADARTDVYSVGAILYETLTGVAPYEGDNFMEVLTKKATIDPVNPSELRPDLPEEVADLVVRAMSRDPDDRPSSMDAFDYELTKCLAGRGEAVANILGMHTDEKLLASLNPGLSMRSGPAGPARQPRASKDQEQAELRARLDSAPMRLGSSTAEIEALAFDPDSAQIDTAGLEQRKSGMGWFGRFTLFVLIVGALGAGAFFGLEEWKKRDATRGATNANNTERDATASAVIDASVAATNITRDGGVAAAPVDAAVVAKTTPDAGTVKKRPIRRPTVRAGGPPRSRRAALALLKRARKAKNKLKWAKARELFSRVSKGRYYRAGGLLGLAEIAFQTKDTVAAIRYASRARKAGAGDAARMLLGHAYFKQKKFSKALREYERVLKRNPANQEAQGAARAARRAGGR